MARYYRSFVQMIWLTKIRCYTHVPICLYLGIKERLEMKPTVHSNRMELHCMHVQRIHSIHQPCHMHACIQGTIHHSHQLMLRVQRQKHQDQSTWIRNQLPTWALEYLVVPEESGPDTLRPVRVDLQQIERNTAKPTRPQHLHVINSYHRLGFRLGFYCIVQSSLQ